MGGSDAAHYNRWPEQQCRQRGTSTWPAKHTDWCQADARWWPAHTSCQHTQWRPRDAGCVLMGGFRLTRFQQCSSSHPTKGSDGTDNCLHHHKPEAFAGPTCSEWPQPVSASSATHQARCVPYAGTCLTAEIKAGRGAPCTLHACHNLLCPQPTVQVLGGPQSIQWRPAYVEAAKGKQHQWHC